MRSFLQYKVYVSGTLMGGAAYPQLAAAICTHLCDGAVVKNADRKVVWKSGVVRCSIDEAAAIIDSAERDDDHAAVLRSIFTRYRGPAFGVNDLRRSVARKLEAKENK